jgi:hypothetical protein
MKRDEMQRTRRKGEANLLAAIQYDDKAEFWGGVVGGRCKGHAVRG